jgi:hypothetical protein
MAWVQEIYDTLFDPDTVCVACISHGKDSAAMLRAIKLLGLPLHRIVTTDVWATQDIPAVLPEMWEWKTEADKIIKELYGIAVEHICAMQDGNSQTVHVEREREREPRCGSRTRISSTKQLPQENMPEVYTDSLLQREDGATSSSMRRLTYESMFYHRYESGKRCGKMYGFPFKNGAWCQSRLKRSVSVDKLFRQPRERGAQDKYRSVSWHCS